MSILTGDMIRECVRTGAIHISPYNEAQVGPNSYDLTLADELAVYDTPAAWAIPNGEPLDMRKRHATRKFAITQDGYTLHPGVLYLASTVEECGSDEYVTYVDGRSSVGRLGIQIHMTAGRGDLGFKSRWTLEIAVVQPVVVYPGVKIGQATFHTTWGVRKAEDAYSGKYATQRGPTESRLWQDFGGEGV